MLANKESSLPVITIITVCRNAETSLEDTIQSVLEQSYSKIEYIIVDGGSTDGTIDIIRKYKNDLASWTSGLDDGIYDAMNKGIGMASGDYIYFLGADDCLVDSLVITKVANLLIQSPEIDLLCGRVLEVDYELKLSRLSGEPLERIQVLSGCMAPHQGMFTRADLLRANQFSIEYKVAADFEFFLRIFLERRNVVFTEECIAQYSCNGISHTSDLWINEYEDILEEWLPSDMQKFFKKRLKQERQKRILMIIAKRIGIIRLLKKSCRGWKEMI